MKINKEGLKFIADNEGFRKKPYLDGGGVPTIGYGSTFYPNGRKVTMDDKPISKELALCFFESIAEKFAEGVDKVIFKPLSQNQFNALVSFAYNVGLGAFRRSTLIEMVNQKPDDPKIMEQFMRWIYDNGNVVEGLRKRRKKEADLYFS